MNKTGFVVLDTKTGEVVKELLEGDRIVSNKKEEAEIIDGIKREYITWNFDSFFKGHEEELALINKELTTAEKAFMFSVQSKVSYDDCHLTHENNIDIGTEDLILITGMSRGGTYETIASLINKDILYKGKNSRGRQYFVNPWLFCKGKRINKVLKTMFKNYKIRSKNNIKWKDLKE